MIVRILLYAGIGAATLVLIACLLVLARPLWGGRW